MPLDCWEETWWTARPTPQEGGQGQYRSWHEDEEE